MFSSFITPVRNVVSWLVARHTPPELAAGFTIGLVIGLVPKGNLIALSLCVLLFSMRVNKGLGVLAALVISCFASGGDPFAHKLGAIVLNFEPLQAVYATVYSAPLGPWIGFDNTVTTGMILLGLYVSYPTYFSAHLVAGWCAGRIGPLVGSRRSTFISEVESNELPPRAAA